MKPDRNLSKMLYRNLFFEDRRSQIVYDLEQKPHLKLKGQDIEKQRMRVWAESLFKCDYCRKALREDTWQMHHVKGGLSGRCDCRHNLAALCPDCHRKQHVQTHLGASA